MPPMSKAGVGDPFVDIATTVALGFLRGLPVTSSFDEQANLIKKVLVNVLDMKGILNSAPDIASDHKPG
jgi:hypothetical protein